MSDTPKFEVIDRRKLKKQEEEQSGENRGQSSSANSPSPSASQPAPAPSEPAAPSAGPRLVVNENRLEAAQPQAQQDTLEAQAVPGMPPAPTAEESHEQ